MAEPEYVAICEGLAYVKVQSSIQKKRGRCGRGGKKNKEHHGNSVFYIKSDGLLT